MDKEKGQTIIHKTLYKLSKDQATRSQFKIGSKLKGTRRVCGFCSTSSTRRLTI